MKFVPVESAAQELQRERARFAGPRALVEIRLGREPIVHRPDPELMEVSSYRFMAERNHQGTVE